MGLPSRVLNFILIYIIEDSVFKSHPSSGKLAYTLPALDDLLHLPMSRFDNDTSIGAYISVENKDATGKI